MSAAFAAFAGYVHRAQVIQNFCKLTTEQVTDFGYQESIKLNVII